MNAADAIAALFCIGMVPAAADYELVNIIRMAMKLGPRRLGWVSLFSKYARASGFYSPR
jgi:hypothetical protein